MVTAVVQDKIFRFYFVTRPHETKWSESQVTLKVIFIVINDYPTKFLYHRHFDIKLSIHHVSSHDHVVRGSNDIMGEFRPVKFLTGFVE